MMIGVVHSIALNKLYEEKFNHILILNILKIKGIISFKKELMKKKTNQT